MSSLGAVLRSERLRQGLTLEQIAEEIKVSPRQLAWIEEEQYGRLPGSVFARSFTRQYAYRLGIPASTIASDLEEIDRLFLPLDEAPRPAFTAGSLGSIRAPREGFFQRSIATPLLVAAGLALLGFGGFLLYQRLQP